jgi:hypothetical protein
MAGNMYEFRLSTRNKPRSRLVKEEDPDTGMVRVFKSSPEDMALQIWSGRRCTMVSLFPAEARAIAHALIQQADLFLEPLPAGELEKIIAAK